MRNKKWKTFDKLLNKCHSHVIGEEKDGNCWKQAFDLLLEIVHEERKENPAFAPELEMLEEAADYEYDIQGWLETCLDEMDREEEQETLLNMCERLLCCFGWPEYTGSDLKFRKVAALRKLGQTKKAAAYCKEWVRKEPENIVAAAVCIYALIETKEFAAAEELAGRFIFNSAPCSGENEIVFAAASKLYEAEGKREEKEWIDKAICDYEKFLKDYQETGVLDEDFWGEELPFD